MNSVDFQPHDGSPWRDDIRVTVAHDYLTQRGGAERVTLALLQTFPQAPLLTSVYLPDETFPEFRAADVRTSWLQRSPVLVRDVRRALPVLPKAWSTLRAEDCDVVVASSTGFAHGVDAGRARKIVYCHNPPRWLYQRDDYEIGLPALQRSGLAALRPYLHRQDKQFAASADRYIANSTSVAARIKQVYGIDAAVVFPPVMVDTDSERQPVPGVEPGFFLTVSRRRGYKNSEIACEAVKAIPGARLVVVGGLPERVDGDDWGPGIVGVEDVSDAQLRWLYANCAALIAPSYEDFGLTPIEAAAFGKPTVALGAGGYLDTVVAGVTGVFASEPTPGSFASAIEAFQRRSWNPRTLREHSRLFSLERFIAQMRHHVLDVLGYGPVVDVTDAVAVGSRA